MYSTLQRRSFSYNTCQERRLQADTLSIAKIRQASILIPWHILEDQEDYGLAEPRRSPIRGPLATSYSSRLNPIGGCRSNAKRQWPHCRSVVLHPTMLDESIHRRIRVVLRRTWWQFVGEHYPQFYKAYNSISSHDHHLLLFSESLCHFQSIVGFMDHEDGDHDVKFNVMATRDAVWA